MAEVFNDSDELSEPRPHLLTLPAELRNRNYRLSVVNSSPTMISSTPPATPLGEPCQAVMIGTPPLMRTCTQLRNEVHGIYFEENIIYFVNQVVHPNVVQAFNRMAGSSASKITSIKVIHALAMNQMGSLRFSAKLEGLGGLETRVVRLYNSKGEVLGRDWNALGDTKDCCCCNSLEVGHRYADLTAESQEPSPLLRLLEEYAVSAHKRKYFASRSNFQRRDLNCEDCYKTYYLRLQ